MWVCKFSTCVRWRRGGRRRGTLNRKGGLHHQLHTHLPQRRVGVRGQLSVCHQLVAVSEIPDVVDGHCSFQVVAGVVKVNCEDHVLATDEHVRRLVNRRLLGDVDRHWDLICLRRNE